MLFRQEDLAVSSIDEAANILNDAVYLTESESFLSPKAIPVVENTRIGAGVVNFEDVYRLSEENGVDYIDAMYAVAEANELDPEQLAVAVDEAEILGLLMSLPMLLFVQLAKRAQHTSSAQCVLKLILIQKMNISLIS